MITDYLPNIAYFIADYYEKFYDESLTTLTNQMQTPAPTTPSLLTSPKLLTTSPLAGVSTQSAATSQAQPPPQEPISQPIVLKISTRKLEIISSLKEQIVDNELCSCIYLYLIIASFELNDWTNLKVLLPTVRYPNNNLEQFEKWFIYLIINMLSEKYMIEHFRHEWFVSLIFDEFLMQIISNYEAQIQHHQKGETSGGNNSTANLIINKLNLIYEQIYKLVEKLYPTHMNIVSFTHLIEMVKPRKLVNNR